MKYKLDGDRLMICADNFVDLASSPAIFIPLFGQLAREILIEDAERIGEDMIHLPAREVAETEIRFDANWVYVERGGVGIAVPRNELSPTEGIVKYTPSDGKMPEGSNPLRENRIGRFVLSLTYLDHLPYAVLSRLMGHFLIVRAETTFWTQSITYVGYSPLFNVVDRAMEPPTYILVLDQDGALVGVE